METSLYLPVKRFLEGLGFEVKGEVCGCDVVALDEGTPAAVVIAEPPTRLKGQTAAEKASLLDAFLKTHYADRTGTSDAQVRARMVTYLVGLAAKQKK